VPVTRIGTIEMLWWLASTAAPRRTRLGSSLRRVPSGYRSRFQPSSISLSRWLPLLSVPPPLRSTGTVLKMSDTSQATIRFV
jgi:hypothetical protein